MGGWNRKQYPVSDAELRKMYEVDMKGAVEIAAWLRTGFGFEIGFQAVLYRLRSLGVAIRSKSQARKLDAERVSEQNPQHVDVCCRICATRFRLSISQVVGKAERQGLVWRNGNPLPTNLNVFCSTACYRVYFRNICEAKTAATKKLAARRAAEKKAATPVYDRWALPISSAKLRELYEEKMMSTREIAQYLAAEFNFKIGPRTIGRRLIQSGAVFRTHKQASLLAHKKDPTIRQKMQAGRDMEAAANRLREIRRKHHIVTSRSGARNFAKGTALYVEKCKARRRTVLCSLCQKPFSKPDGVYRNSLLRQGIEWAPGSELPENGVLFCSPSCSTRHRSNQCAIKRAIESARKPL